MGELYDYLYDASGLVYLINCEVTKTRVLSGLANYGPSLPPSITLYSPEHKEVCKVKIPEGVQRQQTGILYSSPFDDLPLEVIA